MINKVASGCRNKYGVEVGRSNCFYSHGIKDITKSISSNTNKLLLAAMFS